MLAETVMLEPVPMSVPPQAPRYHFHEAPEPSEPPCTVRVTCVPALTEVCEAEAPAGATLRVLMVRLRVAVLGQPELLVLTKVYAPDCV